jgi:hypothetical protein
MSSEEIIPFLKKNIYIYIYIKFIGGKNRDQMPPKTNDNLQDI